MGRVFSSGASEIFRIRLFLCLRNPPATTDSVVFDKIVHFLQQINLDMQGQSETNHNKEYHNLKSPFFGPWLAHRPTQGR